SRRHTSSKRDWSSDVCSSDLPRRLGSTHTAAMPRPANTRQLRMFDADHGDCPVTDSTTQPMDCVDASIVHRKRKEGTDASVPTRSEEHTSELQSRFDLVCRLL